MKFFREYKDVPQLVKAHPDDAGFDLFSASDDFVLEAGKQDVVETGLHIAIPPGYVGIIKPRSGYSVKYGTDVIAGVVDAGYTGEVLVVLTALTTFTIKRKDKIAQMLIVKVPPMELEEVNTLEELGDTERGANGFGSTGDH